MSLPLITIITPTFNAAATLAACMESVAKQTYPNKEHWIIDGLSTDGTIQIMQQYAPIYSHVRFLSEKDDGIYDAMNKGIKLAKGSWLYFLGADDILYNENVLSSIFHDDLLQRNDLIYGNAFLKQQKRIYGHEINIWELFDANMCHQAIFYRRDLFELLGDYIVKYKIFADWAFNIKCFGCRAVKTQYKNINVAVYNQTGFSSNGHDPVFKEDRIEYILYNTKQIIPLPSLLAHFGKCPLPNIENGKIIKGWIATFKTIIKYGFAAYYIKNALYWTLNHK